MNIFQKAITPDMPRVLEGEQIYVYVPQATSTNAGIASYKNANFKVNDGAVSLRWPIQSIIQGPLANPSLIKLQDTEFEYSNANTELEYEGSTISSTISELQIKRDLRDAYNRPDLVMLDPNYFVRTIVEKNGKQYYKHQTTAVHYNMSQNLSSNEQARARLNIGAGSLAVVEQSNRNSSDALLKATSAEQTSVEALEIVKTSDAAAKEAVVNANNALTNSGQAITTANTALTNSNEAITTSNTALNNSNNAISTANRALTNSSTAVTTANNAKSESSQAISTAESANAISAQARNIAQNALDLVTEGVGSQVLVNGTAVPTFNADTKADVTYVNQKIDDIMGPGSTEAIDTILELAAAFKNNSDVIRVLNEAISSKVDNSVLENEYLPRSAGPYKKLTGSLYLTKDTVISNQIHIRGLDTSGNAKSLIALSNTNNVWLNYDNTGKTILGGSAVQPFTANHYVTDLGIPTASFNNIYGKKLYQSGKPVANAENLSAVLDVNLSNDSKTLTVVKRDGTSFNFQGGSDLSNYMTINTEQTISGTKRFTANNNTFVRTLILGANTPINFTGIGNGTYNTGAFVCNTTDKFGVECPRETDSASAAIIPFRVGARGGQLGILQAGDMYQNGQRVANISDTYQAQTTVSTSGAVTQTLSPNTRYNFTGTLTSLTLNMAAPVSGKRNIYSFAFKTSSTGTTVTLNAYSGYIKYGLYTLDNLDTSTDYFVEIEDNVAIVSPVFSKRILTKGGEIVGSATTYTVGGTIKVTDNNGVEINDVMPGGEVCTITATPNANYTLSGLLLNNNAVSNGHSAGVQGNWQVYAKFLGNTTTITWTTPSAGLSEITVKKNGTAISSGATVRFGDVISVSTTAASGYTISKTSTGLSSTAGGYVTAANPTITITATASS